MAASEMPENGHANGRVVRVDRTGGRRRVPTERAARDQLRADRGHRARRCHQLDHVRGRSAHREQHGASGGAEADRRSRPRRLGDEHRRADQGARGRGGARARLQRVGRAARHGPVQRAPQRPLGDPPRGAAFRRARAQEGHARDGDQGHRSARAVRAGRQDRHVRRRRRGQDGDHPGDDPPPGRTTRWRVGVRRRRGADPRRQRPLPGDDGIRGDREDRARLRPDGRAPGRASARGAVGPHHGGVFPRRRAQGRAAVRGQHLPVHPGRVRGVHPARADAVRGGLSAEPSRRDGRPAGADHVGRRPVDHVAAGHLRAGRRHHRPRAARGLRAPGRHHGALA